MPDLDLGPAIEAGADALFHDMRLWFAFTAANSGMGGPADARRLSAAVAIEAALPELRKAIAEECAQAIDVRVREYRDLIMPDRYTNVLIEAAAIVRGQSGGGEHG